MALDSTVSGVNANSYASLAEADAYFAAHYLLAKQTAWSGFSAAQKELLLRLATQVVETLPTEDGHAFRINYDQALTFPRTDTYNSDGEYEIPQGVKDAECEQALYLSTIDDDAMANQMVGVVEEEVRADGVMVRTKYGRSAGGTVVAPMTLALMQPFLRRGGSRLRRA